MSTPTWSAALGVGHATMDAEHHVELALLDALEDAVRRDLGPNRIGEILEQLVEHTNVHFLSEQLLMRLSAYPQYEAHAEEHDGLIEQARQLQLHAAMGEVAPTLVFIESMRQWLTQHMEGRDRALANYLRDRATLPAQA